MGAMGSGGKVELMPGAFRVLLRARELWFKKVEISKDVVLCQPSKIHFFSIYWIFDVLRSMHLNSQIEALCNIDLQDEDGYTTRLVAAYAGRVHLLARPPQARRRWPCQLGKAWRRIVRRHQ